MINGIINIYKEQDFTSFDVVAKLRGILHERKIGHTGTLDPMAEGVLPVCVGSATKLCEMLMDHDKVYETTMLLGVTYDTEDVFGNKLTENTVMSTEEEIRTVISSFIGGYEQTPPMYSAKKVDGKKLYELAREGKSIERKSVFVNIYDIEVISVDLPRVVMRVHCGKGTYIRTLISDIGSKLGCGAAMESLLRTKVGDFSLDNAQTLSEIEQYMRNGSISDYVIPADAAFGSAKSIRLPEELCKYLYNGNFLIKEDIDKIDVDLFESMKDGEYFRIYDSHNDFKAVYEFYRKSGKLKPYKMFL